MLPSPSRTASRGALLAILALLAACGPRQQVETDLDPPYIVSVAPSGPNVSTGAVFVVTFSEPMRVGVLLGEAGASDTVALGLAKHRDALVSALDSPPISATQRAKTLPVVLQLSEDRTTLTLTPVDLLEPLTDYVLVFSKTLADDVNNRLVANAGTRKHETQVYEVQTAAAPTCTDTTPPRVDPAGASLVVGATSVSLTWNANEPGTTALELYAGPPGDLDQACAANDPACVRAEAAIGTCTKPVDPCRLANPPAYVCERAVSVAGLTPETTYAYRIVLRDAAGNAAPTAIATLTTTARPHLVLNELLVSTRGIPASAHDRGKFVEIFNAGTDAVDLAGWKLARCAEAACTSAFVSTWTLKPAGTSLVGPGAFAVAGGDAFEPALMGVPAGTTIVHGSTATLSLLVSSTATAYALVSPDGTVVSTYGAHLPPTTSGATTIRSAERTDPTGLDVAASWVRSQLAVAGAPGTFASPGRENGLGGTPVPTCDDRQPPQVDEASVAITVSSTGATIAWSTDEGGRSTLQLFTGDASGLEAACEFGDPACVAISVEAATCAGAADPCALPDPPTYACRRTARLTGLQPETTYAWRLISSDASANDTTGEVNTLRTTAAPKVALNEVLPVTRGLPASDHDLGKFVELYNGGDAALDLAGWKLARCTSTACTTFQSTWTLKERVGSTTVVPAHGYALAAGDAFDATRLGVPAGVPILKGSTATLSFVTATTSNAYALLSPDGGVVSTYGGWVPPATSGALAVASHERRDPFGSDATSNWAPSTAPVGGAPGTSATPGRRNTVSTLPPACEDTTPAALNGEVRATPGVSTTSLSWSTDEAGGSEATCAPGDVAALEGCAAAGTCVKGTQAAASCSTWVDSCAVVDPPSYPCTRTVGLAGLAPATAYTCRVVTRDLAGNPREDGPVAFTTLAAPKVVLTELLVTTRGLPANDHDRGKFVEVFNAGTAPVDLAGWRLVRCADRDCQGAFSSTWTLRARAESGATSLVPANAFAIVGGSRFDAALLGVPSGTPVLRGSTDTLSFITSSTANTYALVAPTGEVVSKYGAWLALPSSGATTVRSFERRQTTDPDAAGSWLPSTAALATAPGTFATPGTLNTATDAPLPCLDTAGPQVDPASVEIATTPRGATISWASDEAGASEVRIFAGDEAGLGVACAAGEATCRRVVGSSATCRATLDACHLPVPPEFPCVRTVSVTGLEPATTYAFDFVSKDLAGNTSAGTVGHFDTPAAPIVKLVLNEVFASPKTAAGVNGEELKFVELFNAGPTDVDLAGWVLARCAAGDASCTGTPDYQWLLRARAAEGSTSILRAGAFAVVGGDTFNAQRLAVPSDALVVRGATATLLGGKLLKGEARAYALLTPDRAVHSTYGGFLGVPSAVTNDGRSFERFDPAATDAVQNWATSTRDLTDPSGAANFATPGGPNSRVP